MLDKSWVHLCRADPGYERGARKFVRDVAAALGDSDMIICPCKDCRNVERQSGSDVVVHLVTKGMDEAYKMQGDWYHHGDVNSVAEGDSSNVNDWNEEILELYKAAEFFDEELASKARLGDIPEAELAEIAEDLVEFAEISGKTVNNDSDFPAYGNLAGCKVKGKMGCPTCGKNTDSMWLKYSRKHVFMCHRKGLAPSHSESEEDEEIEVDEEELSRWKKRSILFKLPYWEDLPVRHNLDVMHVESNVAKSIVSTLLHCGKSKDGLNARRDLQHLGIRKDLHPNTQGKRTYLPAAPWSLSKAEKKIFCKRLFDFKGPDGYCSNISRGVSLEEFKVTGLKSHDYHVLMQQLLPVALRGLLPKGPRTAILRLCAFYNHLCQRVIDREVISVMEAEIVETLCMFERYMKVMKDFVRNPARPEGCIAESYLAEECMQFCSEFLKKTTSVEEKPERNLEYVNNSILEGRPISAGSSFTFTEMEKNIAHLAVIQNTAALDPYVDLHLQYLQKSNPRCTRDAGFLWNMHAKNFASWLKKEASHFPETEHEETIKWLAYGPRCSARSYTGYIVNGQRFHTSSVQKQSQNSGVYYEATAMCRSSAKDTSQVVDLVSYYGRVTDIILLDYNVFYVPIFRCHWTVKGNGVKVEDGFTLVNLNQSQVSFLKDPYILASQANQVFYSREDDSSSWYVVMRGSSRRYSKEDIREGNAEMGPLPADVNMDDEMDESENARTDFACANSFSFLSSVEPQTIAAEQSLLEEHHVTDQETIRQEEEPEGDAEGTMPAEETNPDAATDQAGVNEEEPEGEVQLDDATERPAKRKRHRGPTKMKNIAKDPTVRERVDYTLMGDPIGSGSVKLSSYVGTLVREHVPINIDNWKSVGQDIKTVLWRSVQARFELDEEFQRIAVLKQMGGLWRSYKSRIVKDINLAPNNQQRMNLRPMNINPAEWRKFVKLKTSPGFKVLSDKYKERRKKQIPHTTSRKGMVRLAEDMKIESGDPSEVTRLKVWVKSRTKKDGTPVNTNAADKIRKAAELVGSDAPTTTTNPEEDHLSQLLGPDNPGRLRAMGRGMSKTKLACFQVKTKCMIDMQEKQVQLVKKVNELEDEISRMKNQRHEAEIGENSAARSVNKRSHPKCVLVDWSGSDENIGEGRILSSDPDDIVNDCRLGPTDLKVLVETATKPDAFLWRPATRMFTIEEAVGQMIAWPASKCVLVDKELNIEDIAPTGLRANSQNKCKLLDLSTDEVIVAEGRWQTQEPSALVNGLPLGPKAVKVFVDSVHQPDTFIWRPTMEVTYLEDCLMAFVSWPVNKVVFENPTTTTGQKSPLQKSASTDRPSSSKSSAETKSAATEGKAASTVSKSPATGSDSPIEDAGVQSSPIKKSLPNPQSPLRKSQRINQLVSKENKKCKLMDITGKKRVVAEGRWATNDPAQKVHFVPLGPDGVKVWVDIVKVSDASVWRPNEEIAIMEDALGTVIAWPEDKVIMS
ncbi:unnamed protein product [Arabidopsis arenosa]|uniref:Uncharacterized protein n=1 Tax=Arabidopsis arenosa TaxID=38785 RepID=A0A8S2AW30_ARAAE|nr:unnamed protein product [Arabidopsis arenosa]